MIRIRPSNERGSNHLDWLESRFTFSFDHYYDPQHMGFGHLRVINEDWIEPAGGFPMHPHRDMEIVTYILEGELEHRDSMGNGSLIRPGVVQRMTAGTGVMHSEFNPSKQNRTHLLQIWIHPREKGLTPGYEERTIRPGGKSAGLLLVASPDGRDGSATIHQDLDLRAGELHPGDEFIRELGSGAKVWVQVARGAVDLNGSELRAGDGAAVWDEDRVTLRALSGAEILVFEMN